MRKALGTALFLSLVVTIAPAAYSRSKPASPLDLALFPAPLKLHNARLSEALEMLGTRVRNGYVLFGVEVTLKSGQEPSVNVDVAPQDTLGEALRLIFRGLPDYKYEVISKHLINVYPSGAKRNPNDVLNLRVPRFDVVNEQPGNVLSRPPDFIPELAARLAPPTNPGGIFGSVLGDAGEPPLTLHLRDVTVRQILNTVSEFTESFPANRGPMGWVYSFERDPKLPGGGKHSWNVLDSFPYDWKSRGSKGRTGAPN